MPVIFFDDIFTLPLHFNSYLTEEENNLQCFMGESSLGNKILIWIIVSIKCRHWANGVLF